MSTELSPVGRARKGEMLRELDAAMSRRNATRSVRRGGVVAGLMLVLSAGAWLAMPRSSGIGASNPVAARPETAVSPSHAASGGASIEPGPIGPGPSGSPAIRIALVATDSSIEDRLASPRPESMIRLISDSELQSLLAAQGTPTGFVRTGGRVMLASDLEPKRAEEPIQDGASS